MNRGFRQRVPNRKDWRKAYHGPKASDRSCRPGGNCPWCLRSRKRETRKPRTPPALPAEGGR